MPPAFVQPTKDAAPPKSAARARSTSPSGGAKKDPVFKDNKEFTLVNVSNYARRFAQN